jgi:hypothetical protein
VAASGAATWHGNVRNHHDDITLPCQLLTSTVQMMMWPPVDFPCLTETLTTNIFQTVTLFDEPFVSLEILRCTLHDHAVFTKF